VLARPAVRAGDRRVVRHQAPNLTVSDNSRHTLGRFTVEQRSECAPLSRPHFMHGGSSSLSPFLFIAYSLSMLSLVAPQMQT